MIDEAEFERMENLAEPCPGSCAMLGTANTMSALSESLGMTLMGSKDLMRAQSKDELHTLVTMAYAVSGRLLIANSFDNHLIKSLISVLNTP